MNQPVFPILWALGGLIIGALISWVFAKSRQREALAAAEANSLQAATDLQIELSSVREKASRVPGLERELTAVQQALNSANERKAALESDLSRLPELEARRAQAAAALVEASRTGSELRESVSRLTAELVAERDNLSSLRGQWEELRTRFDGKCSEANALTVEVAQLRNTLDAERSGSQEKLALLLDAKAALTDQFKSLANDILEEKSKRFTEQNQTNLGALLDPLKLKITEFQTKIEDTYVKEGQERSALGVELKHLKDLNQQLSEDAKNLTRALRGSAKTQGTWGEWILETVLDGLGLRKGHEYVVQSNLSREDGTRALPDVIIHLPKAGVW